MHSTNYDRPLICCILGKLYESLRLYIPLLKMCLNISIFEFTSQSFSCLKLIHHIPVPGLEFRFIVRF